MNTRPAIVVVDDDPLILESLAVVLATAGRPIYLCSDVESAEVVIGTVQVSHVLADIQYSGRFSFEGLNFVATIRRAQPDVRIVLMSGYDSDGLREESLTRGADAFLQKPFDIAELERTLALAENTASPEDADVIRFPTIAEIVGGPALTAHFQPIVDLRRGTPFGFEALARYVDGPLPGNGWMFAYARRKGRSFELNVACVRRALAAATALPASCRIFLNVDPSALSDRRDIARTIVDAAAAHAIAASRVVVELTEEMPLGGEAEVLRGIATLREAGVVFALDDFGSGYAHLPYASAIQPEFVKISQSIGTAFEADELRRRIVHGIGVLAADLGSRLIVEGVESGETAAALRESGVALAQGYFFDRVRPAEAFAA